MVRTASNRGTRSGRAPVAVVHEFRELLGEKAARAQPPAVEAPLEHEPEGEAEPEQEAQEVVAVWQELQHVRGRQPGQDVDEQRQRVEAESHAQQEEERRGGHEGDHQSPLVPVQPGADEPPELPRR